MNPLTQESRATRPIYTVGHSNRTLVELTEILRAFAVECLVDIRRFPRSRTHPQFNGETLELALAELNIAYAYFEPLGGRRNKNTQVAPEQNAGWQVAAFHNYADYAESEPFRSSLDELIALSLQKTCGIMCAEAVWWRCHRRLVSDQLLARGVPVVHLFSASKAEPANLTPFARVDAQLHVTYPAPAKQ